MHISKEYILIIASALIIIISFIFNIISKKTNIPSVLLLLCLGIGIQYLMPYAGISNEDPVLKSSLNILGNVGLILIVLEAALDLKLKKEKINLILKSFFSSALGLFGCAFAIAFIIQWLLPESEFTHSLIFAIPLSIMSSAIIIPSVTSLDEERKEFMIYESTFSDILGIMFFYFLKDNINAESAVSVAGSISLNIITTLFIALIIGYAMVWLLQNITSGVKLFLIIAVLILMYGLGKVFHLSPLIIILFFGLILNNTNIFFFGRLERSLKPEKLSSAFHDFHTLTLESAFVIRTFFFVMFGATITLATLVDWHVAIYSIFILLAVYIIRFVFLKITFGRNITTLLYIAPRGLITVLLFFAIPDNLKLLTLSHGESEGILLFIILITSILMTFSLVSQSGGRAIENLPFDNDLVDDDPIMEEMYNDDNISEEDKLIDK